MRELVLNHASLRACGFPEAAALLPDLVVGMAELVRNRAAQSVLRMVRSVSEIRLQGGESLWDAFLEMKRQGARDQYVFLMRLGQKAPLLNGLAPAVTARFRSCEAKRLPPEDGESLLLCALTDSIAVSLPSEPDWDHDRLGVQFHELLSDASIGDAEEEIDNLARSGHASCIVERWRGQCRRSCASPAELWGRRGELFPHLLFGPDVEDQLAELNAGWLQTVLNRLGALDEAAEAWALSDGAAPRWRCKVTPESDRVMGNPKLREARSFRSVGGERLPFGWHARFGSGGRIHLRFDAGTREIEIGYLGRHLPL